MLLALVLAQALSPIGNPAGPIFNQPSLMGHGAAFESFPLNGAGVAGACSSTPPTGSRGEAQTFTRTGTAICNPQGPATTGIADGELVSLADNIPRVSLVGSLLMFIRETSRTNGVLRSEAIDNAAWTNVGAPTLNGTCATSPLASGSSAPEDYTFAATAAGQEQGRMASDYSACAGVSCSSSIFVKGVSGSGTMDLCVYGGAVGQCASCAYVSTSWTRCSFPAVTSVGVAVMVIGNVTKWNGGTARSSNRVCLIGAQMELGAWVTGYVPTAGATATRGAESAITATLASAIGPNFSIGASMQFTSASAAATTAVQLGSAATDLARVGRNSNTAAALLINATSTTPAVSAMATTTHRGSLNDASGTRTAWWDGASITAPASSMVGATTAVTFGALDAYTGLVKIDPTPGRAD